MQTTMTLFGVPCSLYTAKARSYLRKQGLPFEELSVGSSTFQQHVLPEIHRMIMPVFKTAQGQIVQDGADILRFCDAHCESKYPLLPEAPLLKAISFLFELFGGEGLLRPAMHYRWSFDDINLDFLRSEFRCIAPAEIKDADWLPFFDFASGRMRKAAKSFGVNEQSIAPIEASCDQFLALFEAHLKEHPYLLGGRPTLGDYALMGPLYAHLYRDPKPGLLMRQKAPLVARWVERMNTAEECWVDYEKHSTELIAATELPDTLTALMQFIAEDFMPEMIAHIEFANQWLSERPDLVAGTNGLKDPTQRYIGTAEFPWRGVTLKTSVLPYRFYLLQFLQDEYEQSNPEDKQGIEEHFARYGLLPLLTSKTARRVTRVNHLEVWE